MTPYTDEQLKRTLAKMLPEKLGYLDSGILVHCRVEPKSLVRFWLEPVLDTELLYLCWLVEETLRPKESWPYYDKELTSMHATWQSRTIALAKTKGIEIV